jgi:hypothetical protein
VAELGIFDSSACLDWSHQPALATLPCPFLIIRPFIRMVILPFGGAAATVQGIKCFGRGFLGLLNGSEYWPVEAEKPQEGDEIGKGVSTAATLKQTNCRECAHSQNANENPQLYKKATESRMDCSRNLSEKFQT